MEYSTRDFRQFKRTIGQNLKNIRLAKNISLEEMSRKTGLGLVFIHGLEQGKYQSDLHALFKLTTVLDIPFTYITHNT